MRRCTRQPAGATSGVDAREGRDPSWDPASGISQSAGE